MRTRALTLLTAVAAAVATGASATGATREAPVTAPIVYAAGGSGMGRDLFVREPDGTVRRITNNRVFEGFPRWSPDRSKIVFARASRNDSDLYVMNADGTGVQRLAGSAARAQDLYPTWSPDGRLIAFASNRFGENDIFVMRADGTGVRRVTRTARWVDDTQPVFTPDGKALVIVSNRVAFSNYELFRIRLSDGRVLKRLTRWGANGDLTPGDDAMPAFSPDGKRIAWVSDRPGPERRVEHAIWSMNANGGDIRRVVVHRGQNVAFPRWSPDGRTIVYSTFVFDQRGTRDYKVRGYLLSDGASTVYGDGTEADW
jgi:Tol biopolymer transport system component